MPTIYRPSDRMNQRCVRIESIGRKWVRTSNGQQFEVGDPAMKAIQPGYGYQGRFYLRQEDYLAQQEIENEWTALKRSLDNNPPAGITVEVIQAVRKMLQGNPRTSEAK